MLPLCTLRGEVSYKMAEAKLLEVWRGTRRARGPPGGVCACDRSKRACGREGGARPGAPGPFRGPRRGASSGSVRGSHGLSGRAPGGPRVVASPPAAPPASLLRPQVAPPTLPRNFQGLPPPLSAYLLPEPLFGSAGRFLATTLAEGFSLAALAQRSPGASADGGGPPPHGWPKMENAQRRKMEAPRLRVAFCVPSSPPGAS